MKRLFACSISLICRGDEKAVRTRSLIDDHAAFRWDYKQPAASAQFPSSPPCQTLTTRPRRL